MDFPAQLNRFLEPIRNRIRMLVGRALLSLVDDSKNIQIVQVSLLKDEVKSGVERIQNYGFTSNPKTGGEAVVLFINGNRDQGIAIAVDNSSVRKKNLEEGESAMYNDQGSFILLKKNGDVIVNTTSKIFLGNGTLTATAGVVTGECLCAFTGAPHPDKSTKIFARKL